MAAVLILFVSGCTTEPNSNEDLGLAAVAIIGESSDNADEPDLGRMRGVALGLVDGLPGIALKCDATPKVIAATVCGAELAASESYARTDCRMGMGGSGKDDRPRYRKSDGAANDAYWQGNGDFHA